MTKDGYKYEQGTMRWERDPETGYEANTYTEAKGLDGRRKDSGWVERRNLNSNDQECQSGPVQWFDHKLAQATKSEAVCPVSPHVYLLHSVCTLYTHILDWLSVPGVSIRIRVPHKQAWRACLWEEWKGGSLLF